MFTQNICSKIKTNFIQDEQRYHESGWQRVLGANNKGQPAFVSGGLQHHESNA